MRLREKGGHKGKKLRVKLERHFRSIDKSGKHRRVSCYRTAPYSILYNPVLCIRTHNLSKNIFFADVYSDTDRYIYRKGALLLPYVSHGLLSGVSLKPEERNTENFKAEKKTQNASVYKI